MGQEHTHAHVYCDVRELGGGSVRAKLCQSWNLSWERRERWSRMEGEDGRKRTVFPLPCTSTYIELVVPACLDMGPLPPSKDR